MWELAPMPQDLHKDLSSFGCWNIHRGPINKIFACLTGVLRNRVRYQQELYHLYHSYPEDTSGGGGAGVGARGAYQPGVDVNGE